MELGNCLYMIGRPREAEEVYQEALSISQQKYRTLAVRPEATKVEQPEGIGSMSVPWTPSFDG